MAILYEDDAGFLLLLRYLKISYYVIVRLGAIYQLLLTLVFTYILEWFDPGRANLTNIIHDTFTFPT